MSYFKGIGMEKVAGIAVLLFIATLSSAQGIDSNYSATPPDNEFTKVYIDGANADSNGFKFLLRASERHGGIHFQPYIVDVNFNLMDGNRVVYSDVERQVPVGESAGGSTEIFHTWDIALEEGKNYTALAEIYLNDNGMAEYITAAQAGFTAIMYAAITDIYGDGIGASATVKGQSMVPLDAKVIFTLKQDGRVLEVREVKAPFIMSNDREKTVNILWDKSLQPGTYIISSELQGKEIIARYDKAITVEKQNISAPAITPAPTTPGFEALTVLFAILAVILVCRDKR